jgi:hypothetical protein
MIARRRLLALLAALATFGVGLAVGASSGGSTESTSRDGSKRITVDAKAAEAVRLAPAGGLPALREPKEPEVVEPEVVDTDPTVTDPPVPVDPVDPPPDDYDPPPDTDPPDPVIVD